MKNRSVLSALVMVVCCLALRVDAFSQSDSEKVGSSPSECELRTRQAKAEAEGVPLDEIVTAPLESNIGNSELHPIVSEGVSLDGNEVSSGDEAAIESLQNQGKGSLLTIKVLGLSEANGETIVSLFVTSGGVLNESGHKIMKIENNSVSSLVAQIVSLKGSLGILDVAVDPTYSQMALTVSGLTLEQLMSELKTEMED